MTWKIDLSLDRHQLHIGLMQFEPPSRKDSRPWYHDWLVRLGYLVTGFATYHLLKVW
jgi:hypothetical protein